MNRQHQHLQHPEQHQHQHTVLHNACITFLTQNLKMPFINTYQHLSAQYIDQLVEIEIKRLKANCNCEEENYVEQMLLENPIIVERRTTTPTKTPASLAATTTKTETTPSCLSSSTAKQNHCNTTNTTATTTGIATSTTTKVVKDTKNGELLSEEQRQRSESCRRSRINNKIKKAKMKYRHQFMSNKLLESAKMLECLQDMIEQMETQLVNQDFNALQLLNLRNIFYKDCITAE